MGQGHSQVPETPNAVGGTILERIVEKQPLPPGDPCWLDLLRVELPRQLTASELEDFLLRQLTFRILATNEISGNFPTFIRFVSKTLRAFRRAALGAPPCPPRGLASLCELVRAVVRQLTSTIPAPELLFHFEHTPLDLSVFPDGPQTAKSESTIAKLSEDVAPCLTNNQLEEEIGDDQHPSAIPDKFIRLTYRHGAYCDVEAYGVRLSAIRESIVQWFCRDFPQDVWQLTHNGFVYRDVDVGIITHGDLPVRLQQSDFRRCLSIIPLGVPQPDFSERAYLESARDLSVLREFFIETCEFCVATVGRYLHDRHMMQAQRYLQEILLSLFSLLCPDVYSESSLFLRPRKDEAREANGVSMDTGETKVDEGAKAPLVSKEQSHPSAPKKGAQGSSSWVPSLEDRESHSAPHLFLYLQAIQPFPNMFSPTVDPFAGGPLPRSIFLDIFLESIAFNVGHQIALRQLAVQLAKGSVEEKATLYQDEANFDFDDVLYRATLPTEFMSALLALIWIKGPREEEGMSVVERMEEDTSDLTLVETLTALSLAVVLIFHSPRKWDLTDMMVHKAYRSYRAPSCLLTSDNEDQQYAMANVCANSFASLIDSRYFQATPDDSTTTTGSPSEIFPPIAAGCPSLNFEEMLATLASPRLDEHLCPVMLYALITRNRAFRLFCLTRSAKSSDVLVLAILRVLHRIPSMCTFVPEEKKLQTLGNRNKEVDKQAFYPAPPAATLLLLVLLILTEDAQFSKSLHTTQLKAQNVAWFEHQNKLDQASLGSFLLLVLLRLTSWNFGHAHDMYLHQVCAGVMINMAASIQDLHWFVAEKVVDYFNLLCRQLNRHFPEPLDRSLVDRLTPLSHFVASSADSHSPSPKMLEPTIIKLDAERSHASDSTSTSPREAHAGVARSGSHDADGHSGNSADSGKGASDGIGALSADDIRRDGPSLPSQLPSQLQAITVILHGVLAVLCSAFTSPLVLHNSKLLYTFVRTVDPWGVSSVKKQLLAQVDSCSYLLQRTSTFRELVWQLLAQHQEMYSSHRGTLESSRKGITSEAEGNVKSANKPIVLSMENDGKNSDDHHQRVRYTFSCSQPSSASASMEISGVASLPDNSSSRGTPNNINRAYAILESQLEQLRELHAAAVPNPETPRVLGSLSAKLLVYFEELELILRTFRGVLEDEATVEDNLQKIEVRSRLLPVAPPHDGTVGAPPQPLPQTLPSSKIECLSDEQTVERLKVLQATTKTPLFRWRFLETPAATHYFIPVIWKTIFLLHPNYSCWARG